MPSSSWWPMTVVAADDRGGGGLDRIVGIGRCVTLVGSLEHAEVVVAVAKTDDAFEAQ